MTSKTYDTGLGDRPVVSIDEFKREKRCAAAQEQRQTYKAKAGRADRTVTTDFYAASAFGPVLRAPWVSFFIFSVGLFVWSFLHDDVQRAYGGQVWVWTWLGFLLVSAYLSPRLWHDVDLAMMALIAVIFLPSLWFMALWIPAIVFLLVSVISLMLSPILGPIL